jgi:Zn-dependent protease/CBS domain-containing protein
MSWSFRLGTILGIPIRIHFTFLVILGLLAINEASLSGVLAGLSSLLFIVLLFGCVLLHELGHCVVARRFGVLIASITLYPIGGIAAFTEIPRQPMREILIAIAGPMVNFIIAGGLFLGVELLSPGPRLPISILHGGDFLGGLLQLNLRLGLFNLLPAYPMDGGRILRGLLATRMSYLAATRWAAGIGKIFGGLFILIGVVRQQYLLFIILGVFLYLIASSDERATLLQSALEGIQVRDLMITEFVALSPADTLTDALGRALHTFQDEFPVLREGSFLGVLSRRRIVDTLKEEGEGFVQGWVQEVKETVSPQDSLKEAVRKMQSERTGLLPVVDDGRFVGVVTLSGIIRGAPVLSRVRAGS